MGAARAVPLRRSVAFAAGFREECRLGKSERARLLADAQPGDQHLVPLWLPPTEVAEEPASPSHDLPLHDALPILTSVARMRRAVSYFGCGEEGYLHIR